METSIILGPPGTGKTSQLMQILEYEMKTVEPNRIAFVSYTREGTYQGRDRAIEKFKLEKNDVLYFKTLHSIAYHSLGIKPAQVLQQSDIKEFGAAINLKLKGRYSFDLANNDDKYIFFIDLIRNNKEKAMTLINSLNIPKLDDTRLNFEAYKSQLGLIDFTDMLIRFVEEGKALPVDVAIIDEAQDLTTLQWEFVKIAFKDCKRIYIAGDDDQAIYQWSGADIDKFMGLQGERTILHQSYRLPQTVHEFAEYILSRFENRIEKEFKATPEKGHVYSMNELEELTIKPDDSYLFLSRNTFYLNRFEEYLYNSGVVFDFMRKRSVSTDDVEAINIYTAIQKGKPFTPAQFHILKKYLPGGFNEEHIPLNDWFTVLEIPTEKKLYYRKLIKNKVDLKTCNIKVNTIHSVKGAEADNVILLLNVSGAVYKNIQQNPDSEHRVFYVGATRARKNLYVLFPDQKYYYDVMGA